MKPYLVRAPEGVEWAALEMMCSAAQERYWGIVGKQTLEWTDELRAKLRSGQWHVRGAWDGSTLMGTMIADFEHSTTHIWGMAAAQHRPEKEQLCAYYSLLLDAYPYGRAAGTVRGYGEVEASNPLIRQVFDNIAQASARVTGTIAATPLSEKREGIIAINVEPLDEAYRQGLVKCIEEL